ncbi:uncharacterized protein P174DRAFT_516003 [Aspergillus novofumigatus IBT 16806]|uniref:Uncharacterized protein n=1 Tax=Aspergillus novofumigatus (strain IBT 16806) TaxID=1392255 RepID=A0A2I1BVB0_ASPN1|nr:uncharacterized protein P174DRAFT_516003 [Aspergillus novofumigatus IBT 16806]PKX89327.1 hypothetical protein P174DRAFT_516003 [Aspergillus novofumigatus IBT 16806]
MFTFRPVNPPRHVLVTSTTVLGLGLYVSLFRTSPLKHLTGHEVFVPAPSTRRIADTNALLGVVACALQLPYFLSSYMPIEENQWLHVTVPIRLFVSTALGVNLLLRARRMSEEGFWEFLALGVTDFVGAVMLGWELGRFDGMVLGFE